MPGLEQYNNLVAQFNTTHGINFSLEDYNNRFLASRGLASVFSLRSTRRPENTFYRQTLQSLSAMGLPEVDYFLRHFGASFGLTLDGLQNR